MMEMTCGPVVSLGRTFRFVGAGIWRRCPWAPAGAFPLGGELVWEKAIETARRVPSARRDRERLTMDVLQIAKS
jgi:hypothetical protein